MVVESRQASVRERLAHGFLTIAGSVLATVAVFFVLPVLQAITDRPPPEPQPPAWTPAEIDPPEAPEEEPPPEDEPEEEEPPPELESEPQLLDLAQLELAMNPSFGDGWGDGPLIDLGGFGAGGGEGGDDPFSVDDLEQAPRPIYQPQPVQNAQTRRDAPGTVVVIFVVDDQGRVRNERVQSSSSPAFERPALAAVRQWRFEPGQRNGEAVSSHMRVPITFPES